MVKGSEVLQCNYSTSNKVSNIIRRHIENMKLLYYKYFAIITFSHIL